MATTTALKPPAGEAHASSGRLSPESHNERRHSRHRKSDPFLELPDHVKLSEEPSPNGEKNENTADHSKSLLADLVLTPLNMVAFILSLFLVERRQRQWRLSQHSPGDQSLWFRLTHWTLLDPEPYQDPSDSTWKHDRNAPARSLSGNDSGFKGYYTRKKHRALAKMEFGDAFEMRGRVMIALIAWMIVGILTITYAARRMYAWIASRN